MRVLEALWTSEVAGTSIRFIQSKIPVRGETLFPTPILEVLAIGIVFVGDLMSFDNLCKGSCFFVRSYLQCENGTVTFVGRSDSIYCNQS